MAGRVVITRKLPATKPKRLPPQVRALLSTARTFWHGRASLPVTFWLLHVLSGGIVNGLSGMLLRWSLGGVRLDLASILSGLEIDPHRISYMGTAVAFSILLGWSTFTSVAVWRAAGHYRGRPLWRRAARAYIMLDSLGVIPSPL